MNEFLRLLSKIQDRHTDALDFEKTSNRVSPRYHLLPSDIDDCNACASTISTLFYFEELMAMSLDLQCRRNDLTYLAGFGRYTDLSSC